MDIQSRPRGRQSILLIVTVTHMKLKYILFYSLTGYNCSDVNLLSEFKCFFQLSDINSKCLYLFCHHKTSSVVFFLTAANADWILHESSIHQTQNILTLETLSAWVNIVIYGFANTIQLCTHMPVKRLYVSVWERNSFPLAGVRERGHSFSAPH